MKNSNFKNILFTFSTLVIVSLSIISCEKDFVDNKNNVESNQQANSKNYVSVQNLNLKNYDFNYYAQKHEDAKNITFNTTVGFTNDQKLHKLFEANHPNVDERTLYIEYYKNNLSFYQQIGVDNTLYAMANRGIITNKQRIAAANIYTAVLALQNYNYTIEEMKKHIEQQYKTESAKITEIEREGLMLIVSPLYSYINSAEFNSQKRGCSWWNFLPCVFIGGVSGVGVAIWEVGDAQAGADAAEAVLDWCCGGDDDPPVNPCEDSPNPCCGIYCSGNYVQAADCSCIPDQNSCLIQGCPEYYDCTSQGCIPQ